MTVTPVPNDATGTIVAAWVDALFPRLDELIVTKPTAHGPVGVHDCVIPDEKFEAVAWRCAVAIGADRLRYWPTKFFNWFVALCDAGVADPTEQARAARLLCRDLGTPAKNAPESHLCGLVGETLLGQLLQHQDRGSGLPLLFEGHDWSVTDPGGDCLIVYSAPGGLSFQLWECKAIYGTTATGTVIKKAAEQLHDKAAEYLARFAVVAERDNLPAGVGSLLLALQDLWLDDDPGKGAGVSVATHRSKCTKTGFRGIHGILELPSVQVRGNYASATDFLAFAKRVRELVWKGCGVS